jgi:hypothetical protein
MKKLKIIILISLLVILQFSGKSKVCAQSVAVGEREFTPHPSAILEIQSISKGFLIPRMNKVQREAISVNALALGLLVYQTDENSGFYYYDGLVWQHLEPPVPIDLPNLAKVATSGSYLDLVDKPTIISELRYLRQDEVLAMYVSKAEKDAWNATAVAAGVVIDDGTGNSDGLPISSISWNNVVGRPNVYINLRDFKQDSLHYLTVSKAEKDAWNSSSNFSGRWADLQDKPFIPTHLSEVEQDNIFYLTVNRQEKDAWNQKSNFSGRWEDVQGKPFIPTHLRDLEQDNLYFMTVSKEQIDRWNTTAQINYFSGKYTDLTGKPVFHDVAISGDYEDLENQPILPQYLDDLLQSDTAMYITQAEREAWNTKSNFSGNWTDVQNRPNFHTVATSGNYNDLENKPFIPTTMDQLQDGVGYVRFSTTDKINMNSAIQNVPTEESPLPINRGGTGGRNVYEARINLGLGDYQNLERHLTLTGMDVIGEIRIDHLGRVIGLEKRNLNLTAESLSGMILGGEYRVGIVSAGQSKVNIRNWIENPMENANNNTIASTRFVRDAIGKIGGTGDVFSTGYNSSTNYHELKIKSDVVLSGTPKLNNPQYGQNFANEDFIATTRFIVSQINTLEAEVAATRTATLNAAIAKIMPIGTIIMWDRAGMPDGKSTAQSCWVEITDMAGRFPVGAGQYQAVDGDAGATYTVGRTTDNQGTTNRSNRGGTHVTLTIAQMPRHRHGVHQGGTINNSCISCDYRATGDGTSVTSGSTGGSQSHENRPPFYVVRFFKFRGCQ